MAIKSVASLRRRASVKHKLIEELVKGKNVVHYGCVDDDEDLIKHKFESGRYLHKIVTDSSKKTIGIDLNKEMFGFLKNELSIDNVVYGDVEDPSTFDIDRDFLKKADIVLIPDLIEHLNNPGEMLDGIRKYFSKNVKIIILTPNPTAWYYFVATLFNKEIYSPYHTASFTTENMAVLLNRYGFKIDKTFPGVAPKERGGLIKIVDSLLGKLAVLISPGFADLFLYECSVNKTSK